MNRFPEHMETRTRIFSKRDFQRVLQDFRDNGMFRVEKVREGSYEVFNEFDELCLKGAVGHTSYLVRLDKELLAEETAQ